MLRPKRGRSGGEKIPPLYRAFSKKNGVSLGTQTYSMRALRVLPRLINLGIEPENKENCQVIQN